MSKMENKGFRMRAGDPPGDVTLRASEAVGNGWVVEIVFAVGSKEMEASPWGNPIKTFLEKAERMVSELRAKVETEALKDAGSKDG